VKEGERAGLTAVRTQKEVAMPLTWAVTVPVARGPDRRNWA
jgi:hypothetical protein